MIKPNALRDICIRGVVYPTVKAAADALGVRPDTILAARQRGRLDVVGLGSRALPVVIRGVRYGDCSEAARALGVTPKAVANARRAGTLDRVGLGVRGKVPMRVRIAGRVFESAHDAAAHYGVTPFAVWQAIHQGDPDRIARGRRRTGTRCKPIVLGGVAFPSQQAASLALGFGRCYVSHVLASGCASRMDRVVAAAMAYAARRDRRAA